MKKKDWQPNEEDFNRLLKWLDPDPEQAALTYEKMRHNMIAWFNHCGCHLSEDLADEAFDRVMRRLRSAPEGIPGSPAAYIATVAKHLFLEYAAEKNKQESLPDSDHSASSSASMGISGEFDEQTQDCLEHCLKQLSPKNRNLILGYYSKNKQEKIDARRELAAGGRQTSNALRLQAHRIRKALRKCLDDCLERKSNA